MALLSAFLRLIRWPNLLFIGLTQVLFYYLVIVPSFAPQGIPVRLHPAMLVLLTLSSILIAAAGYIINDYFDLNIDRFNKPDRLVVEKVIKRRSAILWHWFLSGIGVVLGIYISWKLRNPIIGIANIACVILLWFYSTTFKRKLLIGNVIISLLTAWVILVLYVCEFRLGSLGDHAYRVILGRIFKYAIVYSGFAFIISLIREVVKDIEDMAGDQRYGCRTMPIVWGVNVAKVFTATWLVVLISALAVLQFYFLPRFYSVPRAQWIMIAYGILFIDLPLLWILRKLYYVQSKPDYHRLSGVIKGVMLAGILSMALLIFQ